ncbi:pentapeptide repeat-containing protein [Kitasatospora griseola]|uniref:pentapeptide repeat-containing protein n=1 Tax=Kitasatospora griseola TaxID=2064 RepID=UPI00166F6ED8|nr:pentapeptide repeat-containing protein [Kitasatospora griseola]GGR08673.1 hypothetical protein GCM10010195_74190 [Kitasatospora griseola]
MSTPPAPTPQPPDWPHCGYGAHRPDDPVGCRGARVPGHVACLAHLSDPGRAAYFEGLATGDDIDHRGTPFTTPLLNALLDALRDHAGGPPLLGQALFDQATFSGDAVFSLATFTGIAGFLGVMFKGDAIFRQTTFKEVVFDDATFTSVAWFAKATFTESPASFARVMFDGYTTFKGVTFAGNAHFSAARFTKPPIFGPLMSFDEIDLSGAVFEAPVTMEIAADEVHCVRTQWRSTAALHLRYATVDLTDAVLSAPVAITAHPTHFEIPKTWLDETPWRDEGSLDASLTEHLDRQSTVRVASVRGVDAAHLVLTDVDLTSCVFSGAFHLDQVRLEGQCTFARTPAGFHWRWSWYKSWLYRWSRRRTLVEEHHWRAEQTDEVEQSEKRWRWSSFRSWLYRWSRRRTLAEEPHWLDPRWLAELEKSHLPKQSDDRKPDLPRSWSQDGPALSPAHLAAIYRQLRKAFEDSKNEPGAADFYYGEMEMRRHDRAETPFSERALLWAYWLVSGYGLRAFRAVGWLKAVS